MEPSSGLKAEMEHPRGTRESQMEHPKREKRIIQVKDCVYHLATNKSARRLAGLCISRFIRYIYTIQRHVWTRCFLSSTYPHYFSSSVDKMLNCQSKKSGQSLDRTNSKLFNIFIYSTYSLAISHFTVVLFWPLFSDRVFVTSRKIAQERQSCFTVYAIF